MSFRTYKSEGIVLKRRDLGETDRVVTIFTRHHGKLVGLAKGVRRITSRRAGTLEPATQAVFFFARGRTFDLITQSQLISSFTKARKNLSRLTQVSQILEVVDLLTRENQTHPEVYITLLETLNQLNQHGTKRRLIVESVKRILDSLGFGQPREDSEQALKDHLESIVEIELRSKKMLDINSFS